MVEYKRRLDWLLQSAYHALCPQPNDFPFADFASFAVETVATLDFSTIYIRATGKPAVDKDAD